MFGIYACRWACFNCRKAFKSHSAGDVFNGLSIHEPRVCPECAGTMYDIGLDTRPPKKENKKQWAKLEKLHELGFNFHTCGCGKHGNIPKSLSAMKRKQTQNISKNNPDGRGPYNITYKDWSKYFE